MQSYGTSQTVVQRYLLARSDEEARRGAFGGVSFCVPVWALFGVLGACLWGFYETSGAALPAAVSQVQDNVLPHFIKTQLPVGLIGLMLAGLVAAAMSSLDSDLNSIGAVAVQDFYCRIFPQASDRQQLILGRIVVTLFGIGAVLLAQQWIGIESFARYGVVLASIAGGGRLGLFALGFLFPRVTAPAVYVAIFCCLLFSTWATLTGLYLPNSTETILDLGRYNYPWTPFVIGVLGNLVMVSVGCAVSWIRGDFR